MSEQSREPDKYSLDEMIDRLRGRDDGGPSEGELVTRSDGSQAMKVKKRRRRTDQTVNKKTKRNQRVQILQIAGFVVLIVVIGLIAGIGIIYANSSSFRDGLISKVESKSGARVELKQFRINPATANSNLVALGWPAGNALADLQLTNIVGRIAPSSFFGKTFSGEEIIAANGDLVLRTPIAGEAVHYAERASEIAPVQFDRYFVPVLNIYLGGEKKPSNMLAKTEASLFPGAVPGHAELRLHGGIFNFEGWPPLALDRSYMIFSGRDLEVKSLRFEIPLVPNQKSADPGFIEFSGSLKPLDPSATHTLAVELSSFKVSYLIGNELGRFFLGRLETKDSPELNILLMPSGSRESASLELSTTNALGSRIDLSGFKFLPNLAKLLEDRWYELPNFDDQVSMIVSRNGASVELKKFALEERGRMAVRGTIANDESGQLRGKIAVGVPETMILARKSQTLAAMFGQAGEGYRWIDLEIGGTSSAPTDNFLDLFAAAKIGGGMPEQDAMEADSFEELINPK